MANVRAGNLLIRGVIGVLGMAIVALAVVYLFNIRMVLEEFYLYSLLSLAIPIVFLVCRASGERSEVIPWYDLVLAFVGGGIGISFSVNAKTIYMLSWEMGAPTPALIAGIILLVILLEATRRTFGWVLFAFCAFFIFEPLFAHVLPGPLRGLSFPFSRTVSYHVFGHESLLGTIGSVCGKILVGFLIFAGMLQVSGGGKFFNDLALSLFGRTRGAPAKVSVVGSGIFGMFSGQSISNILTTGAFTIPAMKASGYASYYAAAVEACAATGGCLMPPVMAAAAFIMASLLQVPYWDVCIAAALPAFLYYFVLFIQADAYAGRMGIGRMKKEEIPSFWRTLKLGLPYFVSLFILIYFIAIQRLESQAPFYAIIALIVGSFIQRDVRRGLRSSLWPMLEKSFIFVAEIIVLLYTLGVLVGSLTLTGVTSMLSYGFVDLAGGVKFLIPVMVAISAYIMGVGVPATAIYIILSVTAAPALVSSGFGLMGAHLFCFYVGMLSNIVPPVAVAAITAGRLAGERNILKVGFTSMRLGMGLFILPFFFLIDKSLLAGTAPLGQTVIGFLVAAVSLGLLGIASEFYLFRFKLRVWQSILIGLGGIALGVLYLSQRL